MSVRDCWCSDRGVRLSIHHCEEGQLLDTSSGVVLESHQLLVGGRQRDLVVHWPLVQL